MNIKDATTVPNKTFEEAEHGTIFKVIEDGDAYYILKIVRDGSVVGVHLNYDRLIHVNSTLHNLVIKMGVPVNAELFIKS